MKRHIRITLFLIVVLSLLILTHTGCSERQNTHQSSDGDSANTVRVSFIDVGKGDCILIQAGGSSAVIDTGYENTADDVISYLKDSGVTRLDCLVITHYPLAGPASAHLQIQ